MIHACCPLPPAQHIHCQLSAPLLTWRSAWSSAKCSRRLDASQGRSRRRTLAFSAMLFSSLKDSRGRDGTAGPSGLRQGSLELDLAAICTCGRRTHSRKQPLPANAPGLQDTVVMHTPELEAASPNPYRRPTALMHTHRISRTVVMKTSESEAASPSTVSSPRANRRTCTSLEPAGDNRWRLGGRGEWSGQQAGRVGGVRGKRAGAASRRHGGPPERSHHPQSATWPAPVPGEPSPRPPPQPAAQRRPAPPQSRPAAGRGRRVGGQGGELVGCGASLALHIDVSEKLFLCPPSLTHPPPDHLRLEVECVTPCARPHLPTPPHTPSCSPTIHPPCCPPYLGLAVELVAVQRLGNTAHPGTLGRCLLLAARVALALGRLQQLSEWVRRRGVQLECSGSGCGGCENSRTHWTHSRNAEYQRQADRHCVHSVAQTGRQEPASHPCTILHLCQTHPPGPARPLPHHPQAPPRSHPPPPPAVGTVEGSASQLGRGRAG